MRLFPIAVLSAGLLAATGCSSDHCESDTDCTSPKVCRARKCTDPTMVIINPPYDGGPDAGIWPDAEPVDTGARDGTVADTGTSSTADGSVADTGTSSPADAGPGADAGVSDGGGADAGGGGPFAEGLIWLHEATNPSGPRIQILEGQFFRWDAAPVTRTNGPCVTRQFGALQVQTGINGNGIEIENVNVMGAGVRNPDVALVNMGTAGVFVPEQLILMGSLWLLGGAPDVQYAIRASTAAGELTRATATLAVVPDDFTTATPTFGAVVNLNTQPLSFRWTPRNPAAIPMILELASADRRVVMRCALTDNGTFDLPDAARTDFLARSPVDPVSLEIGYERELMLNVPLAGSAEVVPTVIRHSMRAHFDTTH